MTDEERGTLIERLVKASGVPEYRHAALTFPPAYLRSLVGQMEEAEAEVARHGHLGAVWREAARAAEILARRR